MKRTEKAKGKYFCSGNLKKQNKTTKKKTKHFRKINGNLIKKKQKTKNEKRIKIFKHAKYFLQREFKERKGYKNKVKDTKTK